MNLIEAIALAIIQSITEWLPVSSSAHLVIGEKLLGLNVDINYILLLHASSLIAVIIIYKKDILELGRVIIGKGTEDYKKLFGYIIIGTIPIAAIGLVFQETIEIIFSSTFDIGLLLLITGFFLYASSKKRPVKKLTIKNSFIIGLSQAFALLPGISRSGLTISAARILGIEKEKAARFSFLLFIPAVTGALILQLRTIEVANVGVMLAGFTVSLVCSYFTLKLLLKLIKHEKFYLFAYYCWIVGLIIMAVSFKNLFVYYCC